VAAEHLLNPLPVEHPTPSGFGDEPVQLGSRLARRQLDEDTRKGAVAQPVASPDLVRVRRCAGPVCDQSCVLWCVTGHDRDFDRADVDRAKTVQRGGCAVAQEGTGTESEQRREELAPLRGRYPGIEEDAPMAAGERPTVDQTLDLVL
jgi:hypothetical protein